MTGRRKRTLVLSGALAAVLVRGVAFDGWWEWRALEGLAASSPAAAAERAATDRAVVLPAAPAWLRRLGGAALAGAPPALAARALHRIGKTQCAWLPADPDGFTNLARAAVLENRSDDARKLVAQAVRRDPTSPYLLRVAAIFDIDAGRYEEALDRLADAEALAPRFRHPPVEVVPGDDDWIRLEGLRRRAALYPGERTSALLSLAEELRSRGRGQEAADVLAPVHGDPEVRVQLARWALEDGRPLKAATLAAAVAEHTSLPVGLRVRAWSVVALARAASGDDAGADQAAGTAIALGPNSPSPYLALARLATSRDEPQRALELLRRAWGVAPTDLGVLLAVARAAEAANQPRDARLALERAVEVAPERADVAAVLVQYLLAHHEYMDAALRLSRALDRFPTDQRLLAQAARLEHETTDRR